jgi:hypothetical protein
MRNQRSECEEQLRYTAECRRLATLARPAEKSAAKSISDPAKLFEFSRAIGAIGKPKLKQILKHPLSFAVFGGFF